MISALLNSNSYFACINSACELLKFIFVRFNSLIFIFPNPTTDFVIVNMEGDEFENGLDSYQLYDLQGRLIKQNIINQNETKIDLNDLSPSLYLLQVYTNNRILKTFKIIKQ